MQYVTPGYRARGTATEESKGVRLVHDPHFYVTARAPQRRQWYPSGLLFEPYVPNAN